MTSRGGRPAGGRGGVAAAIAVAAGVAAGAACADLSNDPTAVASLEFAPLAFPAVELGDSLRDTLGVARPVQAIARALDGAEITDAPLRYAAREVRVAIDSLSGHVVPQATLSPGEVEIVARFAESLQVGARLRVTRGPDTVARTDTASLTTSPGAIGAGVVERNSVPIEVRVQGRDEAGARVAVADWLVRFAVVRPANPGNDTAAAVFLIDDAGRRSQVDTTAGSGLASRRVRVRPDRFPAAGAPTDTVEVEAVVVRRGQPVPGAPVRLRIPVRRP
jgi:hypothetical protein